VLIAVLRGEPEALSRAIAVLDDPERSFVASDYLLLEVLPKAIYHRRDREAQFYQAFFSRAAIWADSTSRELISLARQQAETYGLSAVDALHVASALSVNAHELVTSEKRTKPIHRVVGLRVLSLA